MRNQVILSLSLMCFCVFFAESAKGQQASAEKTSLEINASMLKSQVQEDKSKFDMIIAARQKHEKEYLKEKIYPKIYKELFNVILKADASVKKPLSISETTDAVSFFEMPVTRSISELKNEFEGGSDRRILETLNKNKSEFEAKYPLCIVGKPVSVVTRIGTRKGILKQIGEMAIIIGTVKVLREDMSMEERLRFFEADRKDYLQKMELKTRRNTQFNENSSLADIYLSSGYLPVDSRMELDFSGKQSGWITRKELADSALRSNWKMYSEEIKDDFDKGLKLNVLGFKSKKEYDEWVSNAGTRLLELGRCYVYGKGLAKDNSKGFQCFQSASELGNAEALANVAICYHAGTGVEQNRANAFHYLKLASEMGIGKAMYLLGFYYFNGWCTKVNKPKAVETWEAAELKGDADSILQLGLLYESGDGVPKSEIKAFQYYNQAATMNVPQAQFLVAAAYEFGHATGTNYSLAKRWYKAVLDNEKTDDNLYAKAKDGYGDALVKGMNKTDDITDFFYGCGHSFKLYPTCKDFSCFDFVRQLASYANSHKTEFDRSKAMRQMMEFIILAKEYLEVAEKYNNMCLKCDEKVKEWVGYHDGYVDVYNDMQRIPTAAAAKLAREAAQDMKRCKAEIDKYRDFALKEARNRDNEFQNATFNWGMAQKCHAILKDAIAKRMQLAEVQGAFNIRQEGEADNKGNDDEDEE